MNFRELIRAAGLTGARLAKLSGVQQTTVSQLELGKVRDPRWSTLTALAMALDTTPAAVARSIAETAPARRPKRPPAKRRIAS